MSLIGENMETAQDKVKKEFEELSFKVGKESMKDHLARAKALVTKSEQNNVSTTKKTLTAAS